MTCHLDTLPANLYLAHEITITDGGNILLLFTAWRMLSVDKTIKLEPAVTTKSQQVMQ